MIFNSKKGFLSNFVGLIAFIVSGTIFAVLLPVLNTIIEHTLAGLSADYPIASFVVLLFPFLLLLMVVYRGLQWVIGGVNLQ